MPITQLAEIRYELEDGVVWRRNRLPTITVRADVREADWSPDGETLALVGLADKADRPIKGFSIGVRFDPALVKCVGANVKGTITEAVGVEYVAPIFDNGKGTFILGVLLDYLPPYEDQLIPATGMVTFSAVMISALRRQHGERPAEHPHPAGERDDSGGLRGEVDRDPLARRERPANPKAREDDLLRAAGGLVPEERDANGRATALRVQQCEAKVTGGKLEIKPVEGTERDIEADLIVSAIGQAVDFTGLEQFNNGKGAVSTDRNYVVAGQQGVFAGGDVIRPHLLTTAIGHGSIAADGIHNYLLGQDLEKRPKIDAHQVDLIRKLAEKGLEPKETHEPLRGTCNSNVAVHNFDDRSDRYIIPHDKLFLGHFSYVDRNKRDVITLDKESALDNFQDRLGKLDEKTAVAEAKRCMSCGMCFECDNCVVYCPQTAVYRVKKGESTTGRYVATDYSKCIGCHICADVCPTGYIQMGLGE